jgi:putative molybdopterin biosynthesis protein
MPRLTDIPMAPPTLLTTRDVAALLRVHPKHVYRLLKRGMPAVRVGDEWRYEREAVLGLAAQASRRVAQPAAVPAALLEQNPAPALVTNPAASSTPPPLLAANGDCAVELVLEALRDGGGRCWGSCSTIMRALPACSRQGKCSWGASTAATRHRPVPSGRVCI